ncbi:MAG: hypothetical protein HYR56_34185 [Acidobacteria bacterium]|nr:hypothetical protein [Acidobacteriota bacterium]MBI3425614.1 hypothetical protein [Acidobacteriota bacterium]
MGSNAKTAALKHAHPVVFQEINFNSDPSDPANLIPLEVIRTENVISKFPVHNLAKTGRVNIKLTRKRQDGDVEFHWEVTYNEKYGEAKQLAYQIDTLIIAKRIYDLFESSQPIPQIIPIGSLYQICQELGMNPQSGKNKNNVKRALGQNAGAFIDAKVTYKDKAGEERRLNAQFSRYAVVHRDQKLPDGRRADQVYIVLQPIYHEVLNNARWRPLNFTYLKELPPGAQRCYEIISTRIFAAIKYGHASAELSYSDYCAFSAQTRQSSYKPFRAQMDHVHKPHLISGYLDKVEYRQTVDAEGGIDWIIVYFPGLKARAEFAYFNPRLEGARNPKLLEGATTSVKQGVKQNRKLAQRLSSKLKNEPDRELTFNPQTVALVRYFHQRLRDVQTDYEPNRRELEQALQLLCDYGEEAARFLVDFALEEAPKTKFDMQVFGAVLVYEKRAMSRFRKRTDTAQAELFAAAEQGSERPEMISDMAQSAALKYALVEAPDPIEELYATLDPAERAAYRQRVEGEIKAKVGERFDWLWDESVREATLKANILRLIADEKLLSE